MAQRMILTGAQGLATNGRERLYADRLALILLAIRDPYGPIWLNGERSGIGLYLALCHVFDGIGDLELIDLLHERVPGRQDRQPVIVGCIRDRTLVSLVRGAIVLQARGQPGACEDRRDARNVDRIAEQV